MNRNLILTPQGEGLMTIADVPEEVNDPHGFVDRLIDGLSRQIEDTKREQDWQRRKTRRKLTFVGLGVGIPAVITSTIVGVVDHRNEQRDQRETAERVAFDARDIDIDSPVLDIDDSSLITAIESNPSFFTRDIPKPADDDSFEHPRGYAINFDEDDACEVVATIDPEAQGVKVLTSARENELSLSLSYDGEVNVCLPGDLGGDDNFDTEVAVQIVPVNISDR